MSGATTEAPKMSHAEALAYEEALDAVPDSPSPDVTPDVTRSAPAKSVPAASTSLRLRMKVWTDPRTLKRYLMPAAFFRDVLGGKPVTNVMYAHAMRDDATKIVTLTAAEWNALPFFYFCEDGGAPRVSGHPGEPAR
jgi:hypothetical protein